MTDFAEQEHETMRKILASRDKALEDAGVPASPVPSATVVGDDDRAIGQLIDERDWRDEVIDKLCDAVLGSDRREWSSLYGFEDAVRDVEERIAALAAPVVAHTATNDQLAAVMLQHGSPSQQLEAAQYAGVVPSVVAREVDDAMAKRAIAARNQFLGSGLRNGDAVGAMKAAIAAALATPPQDSRGGGV